MNTQSDTPETNAEANKICESGIDWHYSAQKMTDFARTLERRNRRLVEALRDCADKLERVSSAARLTHSDHTLVVLQQARTALAAEQEKPEKSNPCLGKLPDPTPAQEKCSHDKWQTMNPQPRHCLECGLQMWDAGD